MNRLSTFPRFSRDLMTLAAIAAPLLVDLAPRTARADEPPRAPTPATAAPASAAAPVAPPAAAAPAPADAAPADAAAPGATVVELAADDTRATIERRVGTASPSGMPLLETGFFSIGQWEHTCVAPCTLKLDPRYAYRVAGDGLVPTDSFSLPRAADRVRVEAKMGSSTGRVAGGVTIGAGILALVAGGLALVATPILHSEDIGSKGFRTGVLAGGIGGVSVGVIAVGVGTLLWLANGSTAHTQVASR